MQLKKIITSLSMLTAVAVSTGSFALMSIPNGWYVEANAGAVHFWNQDYDSLSTKTDQWGANANAGYKFLPYAALEIGYSYYPNTKVYDDADIKVATVKVYSYDIAAKAILPMVDSGFEAFAKLGVDRIKASASINEDAPASSTTHVNSSASASGLYWGLGGQYYYTPEMPLIIQFQRAQGNNSTGNADLWSIGVSYLFV